MRVGVHTSAAGLFSHINFLITLMEERRSSALKVEWDRDWLYRGGADQNVFAALFQETVEEPLDSELIRSWPHFEYTSRSAAQLYLGPSEWRLRLNHWWLKLRVRESIEQEVAKYSRDFTSNTLALHIRNVNIGAECPHGIAPSLEEYAAEIDRFCGRVFLATDNDEAVEFFRDLLGDRLLVREIARSAGMDTEFHLNYPQTVEDARHCLIDALIMSRCSHLLHSVSNVATAVLYMNPAMTHSFISWRQVHRRGAAATLTQRLDVARTLVNGVPEATAVVQHPDWCGRIKLFGNSAFAVEGTTDGGYWHKPDPERLCLRWLDWRAENFIIDDLQDAGAVNGPTKATSSLNYRHQSKIEILVLGLHGSLAEQMFQYAFGLAIARERGCELKIVYEDVVSKYALNVFGICETASPRLPDAVVECWEEYDTALISDIRYDLDFVKGECVWIRGCFQHEAFFAGVADELRNVFASMGHKQETLGAGIKVAVDVRCGKRAHEEENAVRSSSYIGSAIEYLRHELQSPTFLVYSDNPEEAREFVLEAEDVVLMPIHEEGEAFASLLSCEAFVLCGGTLGWWAAWIKDSRLVVCPYSAGRSKARDVFPISWIRIPFEYRR